MVIRFHAIDQPNKKISGRLPWYCVEDSSLVLPLISPYLLPKYALPWIPLSLVGLLRGFGRPKTFTPFFSLWKPAFPCPKNRLRPLGTIQISLDVPSPTMDPVSASLLRGGQCPQNLACQLTSTRPFKIRRRGTLPDVEVNIHRIKHVELLYKAVVAFSSRIGASRRLAAAIEWRRILGCCSRLHVIARMCSELEDSSKRIFVPCSLYFDLASAIATYVGR